MQPTAWWGNIARCVVCTVPAAAAGALQAPAITVQVTSDDEEAFSVSEYSDVSVTDSELPTAAQPDEPQLEDQQTTVPVAGSSDKLLSLPGKEKVDDQAEEEVLKKSGMVAAMARSVVVSRSPKSYT